MVTLTNLVSSFAMGLTILLGQQIGRGGKEAGGKSVGTGIIFFIIIAVIMSIAMLFLAPQLSSLMNAPRKHSIRRLPI